MTSELSVTYRLSRHPSEISRARERARKALTDWGLATHTDLAELIVSELTTNALRHGAEPITVRLAYTQEGDLWLEVHDHGPGRPIAQETTAEDEQGRGLALVDALMDLHSGIRGMADGPSIPGKSIYVALSSVTFAESDVCAPKR
jgi:anti-sigma regulatory factor (Ser/Thr protein kinase)